MRDVSGRILSSRVTLVDQQGRPLERTQATVEQISHEFGFGNIGFDFVEFIGGPPLDDGGRAIEFFGGVLPHEAESLAESWLELFNLATLPFYWRGFEPQRGHPETARLHKTAQWFVERG